MNEVKIKSGRLEKNYSAVLVRSETKKKLQDLRRSMDDREVMQERRLVTAALDMVLDRPELLDELERRAVDVMKLEIRDLYVE